MTVDVLTIGPGIQVKRPLGNLVDGVLILELDGFGVRSDDSAYFSPAGAVAGEEAALAIDAHDLPSLMALRGAEGNANEIDGGLSSSSMFTDTLDGGLSSSTFTDTLDGGTSSSTFAGQQAGIQIGDYVSLDWPDGHLQDHELILHVDGFGLDDQGGAFFDSSRVASKQQAMLSIDDDGNPHLTLEDEA